MGRMAIVAKSDGFGYAGTHRFSGEVLELGGFIGDEKLLAVGYLLLHDVSGHDKSQEVDSNGRRFISDGHRLSFLQRMEEVEAEEETRKRRNLPSVASERDMEGEALEARGIEMSENKGARRFSTAGLDVPSKETCPVQGCDEQVTPSEMRVHVGTHAPSGKAEDVGPSAEPPKPKRRSRKKAAAKA